MNFNYDLQSLTLLCFHDLIINKCHIFDSGRVHF